MFSMYAEVLENACASEDALEERIEEIQAVNKQELWHDHIKLNM